MMYSCFRRAAPTSAESESDSDDDISRRPARAGRPTPPGGIAGVQRMVSEAVSSGFSPSSTGSLGRVPRPGYPVRERALGTFCPSDRAGGDIIPS